MPPRKKATAAKGKKSPDPPARVSPDPPARLSLASSPVASDDESAPGHTNEEMPVPKLTRVDQVPSDQVLTGDSQDTSGPNLTKEDQTGCQPTKKKRKVALTLSDEQEDELAEWIKDHPLLYCKGLKEYKDTAKKQRLWDMKAQELNLESTALLLTWYGSMRTRLGKLTDKKSGDGAQELTDRDQWILDRFQFLVTHISRVPSRQAINLKAKIAETAASAAARPSEADDSGPEVEENPDEVNQPSTSLGKQSELTQTVPQKMKGKKKVSKDKEAEALVEKLMEQQEVSDQLQGKIQTILKDSDTPSPRKTWGAWLTAMMPSLHDKVLNGFFKQSFELMMRHVEESNNIRAMEMQQSQQPQQVGETNPPLQPQEIVQTPQQQLNQSQQLYHFGQSPQQQLNQLQQQPFHQYSQQRISPSPQMQHTQYHPISGQLLHDQYAFQQSQQFMSDTSALGPIQTATSVLDDDV